MEAPGLRERARRFLQAEARHLDVPLDLASVMARRTQSMPEPHVTAAADEPARHLAAQPGALSDVSALVALAYAGAMAIVTRAEPDMNC